MKKYLYVALVILIAALAVCIGRYEKIKKECDRLDDNQRVLLSDIRGYRTKDSLSAASVERLMLTHREFEQYCAGLNEIIKSLRLKNKNLQSVSESASKTEYIVKTVFKDSIVYRDSGTDTLRCINYSNSYMTLSGCESKGIFNGRIESRDTLIQVVHRVPRKFLFFQVGTKGIRQEIVSKNPYSNITYLKYIELK